MSYSTLYGVYKTRVTAIANFQNGHGSAPILWDHLTTRYLGRPVGSWLFSDSKAAWLWRASTDPRIPEYLRLCHAMTFDRAGVPLEAQAQFAEACIRTGSELRQAHPDKVNHWEAIGAALRDAVARPRLLAWGLSPTSVGDSWDGYPKFGGAAWDAREALQEAS